MSTAAHPHLRGWAVLVFAAARRWTMAVHSGLYDQPWRATWSWEQPSWVRAPSPLSPFLIAAAVVVVVRP